jgi:KipI family sensor histidine kinase inhibitor
VRHRPGAVALVARRQVVNTDRMRILPCGHDGVLVEVTDAAQAVSLARFARLGAPAVDVVPGAATVLFDGVGDRSALEELLARWSPEEAETLGPLVELPTTYDGADLADLADLWGTDVAGVVARHSGIDFVSAFCGFAPGFAYLTGLPEDLAVPRRETPRTRVPAGSVALAGAWCGVYPGASPGGWQLLGTTDVGLWDETRDEPALLAPGTRVRFVPR